MNSERDLFGQQARLDEQRRHADVNEASERLQPPSFVVMDKPGQVEEPVFPHAQPAEREYVRGAEFAPQARAPRGRSIGVTSLIPGKGFVDIASGVAGAARAHQEHRLDESRSMTSADRLAKEKNVTKRRLCYLGAALAIVGTGGYVAYDTIATARHFGDRVFDSANHFINGLFDSGRPAATITIQSAVDKIKLSGDITLVQSHGVGTAYVKQQEKLPFNINDPGDWHQATYQTGADIDVKVDGNQLRFSTQKDPKGGYDAIVEVDPSDLQTDLVNQADVVAPDIHSGKTWSFDDFVDGSNKERIDLAAQQLSIEALKTCGGAVNPLIAYGLANQVKSRISTSVDLAKSEHTTQGDQAAQLLAELNKRPIIVRFATIADGNAQPKPTDIDKPLKVPKLPTDQEVAKSIGLKNAKKLTITSDDSCHFTPNAVNDFMKIKDRTDLVANDPATLPVQP